MAEVPALSPRPAGPAHPPETVVLAMAPKSAELVEAPESALLPVAATVTPPEADPHQWQHAVLQS